MDEFEMYKSGMSIPEVSEKTLIPMSTLRFRFKKKGILRSRADAVRLSEDRGRNPHKGNCNPMTEETKEKLRQAHLRNGETNALGISYKPNGYIEVTRGKHKGKSLHVVIMEKHIGRPLKKGEVVHHKDEVRSNNHISNLELMSTSEHLSLHRKNKPLQRGENGQFKGVHA